VQQKNKAAKRPARGRGPLYFRPLLLVAAALAWYDTFMERIEGIGAQNQLLKCKGRIL
jgi:hypothetical protein